MSGLSEPILNPILTDFSPAALVAAIEANFVAWWSYFGHAPAPRLHDEAKILWLESYRCHCSAVITPS